MGINWGEVMVKNFPRGDNDHDYNFNETGKIHDLFRKPVHGKSHYLALKKVISNKAEIHL